MKEVDPSRVWKRVVKDNFIYWVREYDIRCYVCGAIEHVTAVVHEGPYDKSNCYTTIDEKTGEEKKIYPTFAPNSQKINEWDIPTGWSQVTHLTNEFYPMETLTAIHLNLQQILRAFAINAGTYKWVDVIDNDGFEYKYDRDLSFKAFFKNPIKYLKDLVNPQITEVTFDKKILQDQLNVLFEENWNESAKNYITPMRAFEMWQDHTLKQYAQWVCHDEKCHIKMAKKNYKRLAKLEGIAP